MDNTRYGSFIKKAKTYDAMCLFGRYFDQRIIDAAVTRILGIGAITSASVLAFLMLLR